MKGWSPVEPRPPVCWGPFDNHRRGKRAAGGLFSRCFALNLGHSNVILAAGRAFPPILILVLPRRFRRPPDIRQTIGRLASTADDGVGREFGARRVGKVGPIAVLGRSARDRLVCRGPAALSQRAEDLVARPFIRHHHQQVGHGLTRRACCGP